MKHTTSLCFLLATLIGIGTYGVKQQVMTLEEEFTHLQKRSLALHESTHLLQAEQSYLTAPKRLQQLAQAHLGFQPMTGAQMVDAFSLQPLISFPKKMTLVSGFLPHYSEQNKDMGRQKEEGATERLTFVTTLFLSVHQIKVTKTPCTT